MIPTPDPSTSLTPFQAWAVSSVTATGDLLGLLIVAVTVGFGFLVLSVMLRAGLALRR